MARTKEEEEQFVRTAHASREFLNTWPYKVAEIVGTPTAVWLRLAQAKSPHKSLESLCLELLTPSLYDDSICSFAELVGKEANRESEEATLDE